MRKIAVFTGTRAEYGLLYWVLEGLRKEPTVEPQLFVGGMHLSPEFGNTVEQIERDGFQVTERLEFLLSSDTSVGISKSMGLALICGAEALDRHKPDILVLLGDRYEALAMAQAAMNACIPIAHIHGGETTEGLVDEAIRHSITKMSHLHFTATEAYRQRVIQLGEEPGRVFNYGATGIDSILKLDLLDKDKLAQDLSINMDGPYFMITYHPVTLEKSGAPESFVNLLTVLENYSEYKAVISYPNADLSSRAFIQMLESYRGKFPERVLLVKSLGQLKYLSLLKYCSAVIGNSSSGLIEAPTFKVPTINIGNRQKGRITGETVIQCDGSISAIREAIELALSPRFSAHCKSTSNPYGDGQSSERIVKKLVKYPLEGVVYKSFYDLGDT